MYPYTHTHTHTDRHTYIHTFLCTCIHSYMCIHTCILYFGLRLFAYRKHACLSACLHEMYACRWKPVQTYSSAVFTNSAGTRAHVHLGWLASARLSLPICPSLDFSRSITVLSLPLSLFFRLRIQTGTRHGQIHTVLAYVLYTPCINA